MSTLAVTQETGTRNASFVMFSPQVRLILVAAAAALGTAFLLQHRSTGFLLLAAAALWAWGYFRHGTIHAAVTAYRRGDVERARRLLAGVPDPARLTPQDQAYYHWLRGSILVEDGHLEPAKTELGLAVEGRLRTENDRSLVHCQLAELAIREGAWAAAQEYLRQARMLRHRPQVDAVIQQLAEQVKGAN